MTYAEITACLQDPASPKWASCAAWIMREAAYKDVWRFVKMTEIACRFEELAPRLGERSHFWSRLVHAWREVHEDPPAPARD